MVYLNEITIALSIACGCDDTRCYSNNFSAILASKIDTTVPGYLTGEWIGSTAVTTGHPTLFNRSAGNKYVVLELTVCQQRFKSIQLMLPVFNLVSQLVNGAN